MGLPSLPMRVKLVAGLLYADEDKMAAARAGLEDVYGPIDSQAEPAAFDFTTYYNNEFGHGIMRQYLSFRDMVEAEYPAEIKEADE